MQSQETTHSHTQISTLRAEVAYLPIRSDTIHAFLVNHGMATGRNLGFKLKLHKSQKIGALNLCEANQTECTFITPINLEIKAWFFLDLR